MTTNLTSPKEESERSTTLESQIWEEKLWRSSTLKKGNGREANIFPKSKRKSSRQRKVSTKSDHYMNTTDKEVRYNENCLSDLTIKTSRLE